MMWTISENIAYYEIYWRSQLSESSISLIDWRIASGLSSLSPGLAVLLFDLPGPWVLAPCPFELFLSACLNSSS